MPIAAVQRHSESHCGDFETRHQERRKLARALFFRRVRDQRNLSHGAAKAQRDVDVADDRRCAQFERRAGVVLAWRARCRRLRKRAAARSMTTLVFVRRARNLISRLASACAAAKSRVRRASCSSRLICARCWRAPFAKNAHWPNTQRRLSRIATCLA